MVPYEPLAHAVCIPAPARLSLSQAHACLKGPTQDLDLPLVVDSIGRIMSLPSLPRRRWPQSVPKQLSLVKHVGSTPAYMSLKSMSEHHGLRMKMARLVVQRYFCALYQIIRQQARTALTNLVAKVQAAGGECIVYSEYMSYDETPLPLNVRATEDIAGLTTDLVPAHGEVVAKPSSSYTAVEKHAKILQTECVVSVLFRLHNTFQEVHFELPCALQVVDRCTGETYVACSEASRPPFESIIEHFKRSDRHVMADGDTTVARAERALENRGPCRRLSQLFCRVHRICKIATKGVDHLLRAEVSSIIHIALALQSASAMRVFRR